MNFAQGCISKKNFLGVYKKKRNTENYCLLKWRDNSAVSSTVNITGIAVLRDGIYFLGKYAVWIILGI